MSGVYYYNGQEYTMRLYESSKFPAEIGSHKTLVVDGDNPNKLLSTKDFNVSAVICPAVLNSSTALSNV